MLPMAEWHLFSLTYWFYLSMWLGVPLSPSGFWFSCFFNHYFSAKSGDPFPHSFLKHQFRHLRFSLSCFFSNCLSVGGTLDFPVNWELQVHIPSYFSGLTLLRSTQVPQNLKKKLSTVYRYSLSPSEPCSANLSLGLLCFLNSTWWFESPTDVIIPWNSFLTNHSQLTVKRCPALEVLPSYTCYSNRSRLCLLPRGGCNALLVCWSQVCPRPFPSLQLCPRK